tara:strand:+ start:181 stop:447 length:267 start_codon:yes stop_codon:yes gene_type:complete
MRADLRSMTQRKFFRKRSSKYDLLATFVAIANLVIYFNGAKISIGKQVSALFFGRKKYLQCIISDVFEPFPNTQKFNFNNGKLNFEQL